MSYKTILVHCDGDKVVNRRIGVACDLAKRFGSHLVGLHVQPPFTLPAFTDTGFAIDAFYQAYEEGAQADKEAAAAAFAEATKSSAVSSEWRAVAGNVNGESTRNARCADLAVVGQDNPDAPVNSSATSDLAEAVALSSGHPVLVVPFSGPQKALGKTILLCWNGSREAARVATDALPLLKQADKVNVLVVSEGNGGREPGTDILPWLGRHGIEGKLVVETGSDADAGDAILTHAGLLGADLIVMGLYGHSRTREFILGGASRSVLAGMPVPVLMAH